VGSQRTVGDGANVLRFGGNKSEGVGGFVRSSIGNISVGVGAIVAPLKSVGVGGLVLSKPVGNSVDGSHVGSLAESVVGVGSHDGSVVGLCVGLEVGAMSSGSMLMVGLGLGLCVGVGSKTGDAVGSRVGLCVGLDVTSSSSLSVGIGVGLCLPHIHRVCVASNSRRTNRLFIRIFWGTCMPPRFSLTRQAYVQTDDTHR